MQQNLNDNKEINKLNVILLYKQYTISIYDFIDFNPWQNGKS